MSFRDPSKEWLELNVDVVADVHKGIVGCAAVVRNFEANVMVSVFITGFIWMVLIMGRLQHYALVIILLMRLVCLYEYSSWIL